MIVKILLVLIYLSSLTASELYNVSLLDFAKRLSNQNNINIFIDENLRDTKISLYVPYNIKNSDLLSVFKKSISKLDLNLKQSGTTFYLSKKIAYKEKNYMYKLKNNSFKDCENILKTLEVKYSYLKDSNTFLIKSTSNKYIEIKKYFSQVDVIQKQVMLKIMIFEFTDSDIKERGVQYTSIYDGVDGAIQYALNTIVAPFSSNSPTLSSFNFYGAIRLLNERNDIKVKQYPYILAKNNQKFKFEAVENIPYLVSTTTTQATNTSEQNSIEYKDVGMKINGKSFIYDDFITLDIELIIEDLITNLGDSMPQTYKRVLESNTNILYNNVLLLSGIKRIKHIKNDWNVPYISNIPYLGEAFKYSTDSEQEINITIAIEVLNDIDTFKSVTHLDKKSVTDEDNKPILLGDLLIEAD